MAHPFCCFDILNRGGRITTVLAIWNMKPPDFCAENPSPRIQGQEGTTWFSQSCHKQSGTADIWSEGFVDHIIRLSASQLMKHFTRPDMKLQPAGRDQSQRHKVYKRSRETRELVRVLLRHRIFYTKGHSSITNPHHAWRTEGKKKNKINPLTPKKEFWNKLCTDYITNHSRSFTYQLHPPGFLNQCTLHHPWG